MTFELSPTTPGQKHDDKGLSFWPTPVPVIRAVLEEHPPPKGLWMVEPSAGEGPIAKELAARGHRVTAIEVREECEGPLEAILPASDGHEVIIADWLRWKPQNIFYPPFPTIGSCANPPYAPPEECLAHVHHMLKMKPVWMAWLLPLAFVASIDRAHLLDLYPPAYVRPLVPRPKFAPEGGGMRDVAWHIWLPGNQNSTFKPLWWKQYC